MDKIAVKFCAGTTCYVMGGSELSDLERLIPAAWKGRIVFSGDVCLGFCKSAGSRKPPFVQVGDRIIEQASTDKVLATLRGMLA